MEYAIKVSELAQRIAGGGGMGAFQRMLEEKGISGFSSSWFSSVANGSYVYKREETIARKLEQLEGLVKMFLNNSEVDSLDVSFSGITWALYFFANPSQTTNHAEMSRTIMFVNESGRPHLQRPFKENPLTAGKYTLVHGSIYEFEFNDKRTFLNLHIKVNLNASNEISVGAFTASERNSIYGGTVVFFKIEGLSKPETRALSIIRHPEEFATVPSEIRDYLSRSEASHIRVPDDIVSLKSLGDYNKKNIIISERDTLFIEPDKLHVFISTPTFSLTDTERYASRFQEINSLMKSVLENLPKAINRDMVHIDYPGSRRYNNDDKRNFREVVESIKKSSLFVLIIREKVITFSLVELGLALAFSKKILIFGKSEFLPENINALHTILSFLHITENDTPEQMVKTISDNITDMLK